jgi:hypothetical protein
LVNGSAADLFVDGNDFAGVKHAVDNLKSDIDLVCGLSPNIKNTSDRLSTNAVIIGTIGKNSVIDDLISKGMIDVSKIKDKWESYIITFVENPVNGVYSSLVIVGSDKRGTIFGIYKISEIIGVSPWVYWADANPVKQKTLLIPSNTIFKGEPSIKYRGIFLNDEGTALATFVKQFGNVSTSSAPGFNHNFYTHVFDLILRLQGNYLWPAMWNNAFWVDDAQNPVLADEYGVVMGTSHQEFLASSDKEWTYANQGSWNFISNRNNITTFWTKNIQQRKGFENVYTVGLRGQGDSKILPNGTTQENINILHEAIDLQREILTQVNSDIKKVPQILAIYKEVEEFYYAGLDKLLPDDIILVLCEDNHGNLRSLPTSANRNRSGGFGIYYHFQYHGRPRGYRWINCAPLEKTREQMMMAYDYGVKELWVVNVGDLKPYEVAIDYWFHLANDVKTYGVPDGPAQFYKEFAEREFGSEVAEEVADILHSYLQLNNMRKPEIVSFNTFNTAKYNDIYDLLLFILLFVCLSFFIYIYI